MHFRVTRGDSSVTAGVLIAAAANAALALASSSASASSSFLLMVEMVLTRFLMPLNGSFLIEVKMRFLVGFFVYFVLLFEGIF